MHAVHAARVLTSPVGDLWAEATGHGLSKLHFGTPPGGSSWGGSAVLDTLARQLDEYWAGKLRNFAVPLDLQGSPFQLRVWQGLLGIPWGKTRTYLEQARALGDEKSIRAVAAADGRNPIAIVVPCHRVVGSDGSLTGYAGGIEVKQFLLELEGALPDHQPTFGF